MKYDGNRWECNRWWWIWKEIKWKLKKIKGNVWKCDGLLKVIKKMNGNGIEIN